MKINKNLCDTLAEFLGYLKLRESEDEGITYLNVKDNSEITFNNWEEVQEKLLRLVSWKGLKKEGNIDDRKIIKFADDMLTYLFALKVSHTPKREIVELIENVMWEIYKNGKYKFEADIL